MPCRPTAAASPLLALFVWLSLCPWCLGGESADAEVKKPYQLQVVLHIAKHPLLTGTDVFKQQVMRELRDSLQAALGNMGDVEVTDSHPQLKTVLAQGLGPALDGWKQVSETKTHFVLIDFANGKYEIQARQHDGLTGLSSPVVRRATTTDRPFVARTAALLIDRDFGVVGFLEPGVKPDAEEVRVTLKGAGLGVPLGQWVKPGDVFAVARVSRAGDQWRSERAEWTLLQVQKEGGPDAAGVCRCKLYHRYVNPLSDPPYRCIKLGTAAAPLRLQLVDEKTRRPLPGQQVKVSHVGFSLDTKAAEDHASDAGGFVVTREPFDQIAFVMALKGGRVFARIPVEIVADRTARCEIGNNPEVEQLAQFTAHRERWDKQLTESLMVAGAFFKELRALVEVKKDNKAALARAESGLESLREDIKDRTRELGKLRDELKELGRDPGLLSASEKRLEELSANAESLDKLIASLKEAIEKAGDPRRAALVTAIALAYQREQEAEFEDAAAKYQEVIKEANALGEAAAAERAKQRLDELRQALTPKDDRHRQAQEFFRKDWPARKTTDDIKQGLPTARRMFKVCQEANDRLTPRRLLKANLAHASQLIKRLEALRAKDRPTEADKTEAESIEAIGQELRQLTQDVEKYLQPAKPAAAGETKSSG